MRRNRKPTEVPASLKTINVKAVLRNRGIYLDQRVNRELKEAAIPLAKEMLKARKKGVTIEAPRHSQFSNEQVQQYWEKQIHIVQVLEDRFDNKLRQFIGKIIDGFLLHLESEVALTKGIVTKKFKAKDYFSDIEDDLLVQAQFDFTPLLIDQAVLAGQEAYKLIGTKDIYTPFKLRETIAENVKKFTESMLDTDRETLIKIVTDGIESGQSVGDIRGVIQSKFSDITKVQAQRITRTEVLRASNQGALDAYEQSGVVEGKQWVAFGSVDECADYDGDIVADLGGNFYSDISEFKDGDPPLHPNCRCIILPVLIDEKGYIPLLNKNMAARIKELESQIDKRTKAYKELKAEKLDDELYIERLQNHVKALPVIDTPDDSNSN